MMRYEPPWCGAFHLQSYFHRRSDALPSEAVAAIRAAILDSPYLGVSDLSENFTGTYGFSIAFWREELPQVISRFPALAPFLAAALLPGCNVYLLNPLLVPNGRGVKSHIDRSLSSYDARIGCPVAVTVLYVQVPSELAGGVLRLHHRGRQVGALTPVERSMVTFRGDVVHEVVAVEAGAPVLAETRISLVIEQYRAADELRANVPRFELRTAEGVVA